MTRSENGASRRWLLHRARLLRGDWHIHTTLTDGQSTVRDCCEAARERGLQLIAFTEHVRRELSCDFGRFIDEVAAARREFPDLVILRGCEAAVRNVDGELDVADDVLAECDLVLGAFHAFPDPRRYHTAVLNMLANPHVDVWAHPTLYARQRGIALEREDVVRMVERCREHAVLLELNARHHLPAGDLLAHAQAAGLSFVWGSDARHAREVGRRWNGMELSAPAAPSYEGGLGW
jgi:histidinol phosphatase-like PHP family hydrolase